MPMTCPAERNVSGRNFKPRQTPQRTRVGMIDVIINSASREAILKVLFKSCDNIQKAFYGDTPSPDLDNTRALLRSPCSHYQLLYVFFTMLNVDCDLKDYIFGLEHKSNHYKLVRFYTDLRKCVVCSYSKDTDNQIVRFVDECETLYVIS